MGRWSDPGPHQNRRRRQRARRENDVTRLDFLLCSALHNERSVRSPLRKKNARDGRVGADFEIGTAANFWPEIGPGSADAPALLVHVDGHFKNAVFPNAVLVREEGDTARFANGEHGAGEGRPDLLARTADRKGAMLAMQLIVDVEIALELLEIRQAFLPGPALETHRAPLIKVF